MENNMFSGIFRGLKIKNREKSQFFTCLVEAAGVFFTSNPNLSTRTPRVKSAEKRHFCHAKATRAQVKNFCFNFFRGFFGDFHSFIHPSFEGWCCE